MNETLKPPTSVERAAELVPIYVMGKRYEVPPSLTIQKALESAGYQLVRGCGCRGGICGACATVYRLPDSHRLGVGLACQTVVQPDMHLSQIPFFPANRAHYDLEQLTPDGATLAELYPEIYHCIGCNTCTRDCPMDIDVMQVMALAMRGDVEGVAKLSFDCVMCGICAARCPAEEAQYNVAILARRLYGRHLAPRSRHLAEQCEKVRRGHFDEMLNELRAKPQDELRALYSAREIEPALSEEGWRPEETTYL